MSIIGLPQWLSSKESACNIEDTQEMLVQSLGQADLLEEEMANHSSNPVWKIPQSEDSGRLQSMGSQEVGHNEVTEHELHGCQLYLKDTGRKKET